jgi:N-acetylmuramoyl-L-alanine amidase
MSLRLGAMLLAASALLSAVPLAADAQPAQRLYDRALERERELRMAEPPPTREQLRKAINAYDAMVRRFPRSGYSDNALWQAGHLALLSYERFGQPADRQTAWRLLGRLKTQYPTSSLAAKVGKAPAEAKHVNAADGRSRPAVLPPAQPTVEALATAEEETANLEGPGSAEGGSRKVDGSPWAEGGGHKMEEEGAPVLIRNIKRSALPDGVRVTVELAGEVPFRVERLENPRRVFFDLKGTRPAAALQDARLRFRDEPVREMRLGRHPHNTTRIVFDMEGVDSSNVFTP